MCIRDSHWTAHHCQPLQFSSQLNGRLNWLTATIKSASGQPTPRADEGIAGWMISCLGDFQQNDHEYNTTETMFSSHPKLLSPSRFYIWHSSRLNNIPPITTICEALCPNAMTVCRAFSKFFWKGKWILCLWSAPAVSEWLGTCLRLPLNEANDTYS